MSSSLLPPEFHILDSSDLCFEGDVVYPFALDEVVARKVGEGTFPPVIHLWRHRQALVLGMRDRRLPNADETMRKFEEDGFSVTVRNSGGAVVPIDSGVLNVSVILPNPNRRMAFNQDFEMMYQLIKGALGSLGAQVDKGEISGSYCPGDYDLSVNGRKFCGIAQRRQTAAFIVQAFVVVDGSGEERADWARQFYENASHRDSKDSLLVRPRAMASLSELFNVSMDHFRQGLVRFLMEQGGYYNTANVHRSLARMETEIERKMEDLKRRYEARERT